MAAKGLVEALGNQAWLEPLANTLQQAVGTAFTAAGSNGQAVKDFLHGVWLGHPLHPALTDVPVGAWTVALALDALEGLSGRDELGPGADAAVTLGLVGAAGAAVTGLTDWHDTDDPARRVGLVHGLLNTGAALLYTASLLSRRGGNRAAGRGYAALGYAVATVSAYLGGELVFQQRIGVDHAAGVQPPADWTPVYAAPDLPSDTPRGAEVNGMQVVLVRKDTRVYALNGVCSHLGGPLAEGHVEGEGIVCPWHGSCFALDDGRVLSGPATFPEVCLETRVRDGQIEVRALQAPGDGSEA
ncbi:MAG TPA: Rieske 2Fe-2S domain-containing protein [Chloroflexota bacterium]|nr:Rieske 2Fe-2S domain-containing protein [Chloroflexota bacterium]